MSNFQFLQGSFPNLAETAEGAERLVYIHPQGALMCARQSLESLVFWLYKYDKKLSQPYDSSLHNFLNQADFKALVTTYVWDKMDVIRMAGNQAVHGKSFNKIKSEEALTYIRHLFLIYTWFERNYGSPSKDRSQPSLFNPALIAKAQDSEQVQASQEQLQQQAKTLEQQFKAKYDALRVQEQQLLELSASLEEREKLLATIDADLAEKRQQVEQANCLIFLSASLRFSAVFHVPLILLMYISTHDKQWLVVWSIRTFSLISQKIRIMKRTLYIAAYDVREPKRLIRMLHTVKDFG